MSSAASVLLRPAWEPASAEGLRIALFSGNYNCVRDGANRALNRLVDHLLDRGAAVRVYSPTVRMPAFAAAGDLVSVPSIALPGRPEYRVAFGLSGAARRDLADFRPTHFHLSCPDLLGSGAQAYARSVRAPVVASMHTRFETYPGYYGLDFLTPAILRRLRNFYSRSDYVLAPNAAMAESVRGFGIGPDRVGIWGRGVDADQFNPARRSEVWRRSFGYSEGEPVVAFFGRLVREKGIDAFADTVRSLGERGMPVRPLVIGDGPARAWLAEALPQARFTGHLDGTVLGTAVASADILVNPSVTEAFGNVNLEAMAAGLAVVSADMASARALIEHGRTGLLVAPNRPEAYADVVESLLASTARRRALGLAAVAASAAHNWDDILDGVIAVYRGLGF